MVTEPSAGLHVLTFLIRAIIITKGNTIKTNHKNEYKSMSYTDPTKIITEDSNSLVIGTQYVAG